MRKLASMGAYIVTAGAFIGSAAAAERVCVLEDFMGVNCFFCQYSAPAVDQLVDENPDRLAVLGVHAGGFSAPEHRTTWGNARNTFYAITGYPTVWIDGVSRIVGAGAVSTAYFNYNTALQARLASPTDVVIQLGAEQVLGSLYRATVRVSIEPTGQARPIRLHILQVLDNWPTSASYGFTSKNTVRAGMTAVDFTLNPGQTQEVTWDWSIDAFDLGRSNDIRLVVVAQQSTTRTVYQGAKMAWPFTTIPPVWDDGDMDCNGAVDFNDINGFVVALVGRASYEAAYPDCVYENADVNDDGLVNFADIDAFVAALVGG